MTVFIIGFGVKTPRYKKDTNEKQWRNNFSHTRSFSKQLAGQIYSDPFTYYGLYLKRLYAFSIYDGTMQNW